MPEVACQVRVVAVAHMAIIALLCTMAMVDKEVVHQWT